MPTPRRYATPAARQAAYRQRCAVARQEVCAASAGPSPPAIALRPGQTRWRALIRQAGRLLQTVDREMQAHYEQRSERWQESERGEAFLENLQAVHEAQSAVEELGI